MKFRPSGRLPRPSGRLLGRSGRPLKPQVYLSRPNHDAISRLSGRPVGLIFHTYACACARARVRACGDVATQVLQVYLSRSNPDLARFVQVDLSIGSLPEVPLLSLEVPLAAIAGAAFLTQCSADSLCAVLPAPVGCVAPLCPSPLQQPQRGLSAAVDPIDPWGGTLNPLHDPPGGAQGYLGGEIAQLKRKKE
jgi:hypothetical protein